MIPAPAPNHAATMLPSHSPWVGSKRSAMVARVPGISHPLTDIPYHIRQPETIAPVGSDWHQLTFPNLKTEFIVEIIRILRRDI